MTLCTYDLANLDRLAANHANVGKRRARAAYNNYAVNQGWGNTPAWVLGRDVFNRMWRQYRAAYNEKG